MRPKRHLIRQAFLPLALLAALLGGGAQATADDGPYGAGQDTGRGEGAAPRQSQDGVPGPGDNPAPGLVSGDPADLVGGDPRASGAKIFTGDAFDTCLAPSLATMRAWHAGSPFGAVGVYFGGRARACPNQPRLNSAWVTETDRMGWKLLPVYVGSQSPCVGAERKRRFAMSEDRPAEQGAEEGRDAVARAKALGMAAHSALYLDMEAYDNSDARCAVTTLAFIQGWNRAVQKAGYLPGFYCSADSGIEHMEGARKAGRRDLPQVLWFARWRVSPSVDAEKALDKLAWQPHRRIHQYDGNVQRTYGGHRLNIDRNVMDAPVAVVG